MSEASVSFGPYTFDRPSTTLRRDGEPVPLGGRAERLLAALIDANGAVLRKRELMEAGWAGTVVEDRNLTVQVAALRKAIGRQPDGQDWIKTVPRVGYRLVRTPVPPPPAPRDSGKPSVVVLPFVNLGNDPDQDYFADGIVEDLITALSRFKTFSVIARNSAFTYKGRAVDVRQVARDLCIRYAVEGSVRRNGNRVRVSAQLIDAATGNHLWAENFDGQFEDIFDMQDRITESVVGLVEPQITRVEIERARRKHPENLDAYDLYLQALPLIATADIKHYDRVIDMLDRAVALDPAFPQAVAHAAWSHEWRNTWGGTAPKGVDDLKLAVELAELALVHGKHDATVLALCALQFHYTKRDWDAGIALIERALEMNPNSHVVLNIAGIIYDHRNEFERSTGCYLRALRLSPGTTFNFWSYGGIASNYFNLGKFEEAVEWARRAVGTGSKWQHSYRVLVAAYANLGRIEEARETLAALLAIRPGLTIADIHSHRHRAKRPADEYWIDGMRKAGLPEGPAPA